MISVIVAKLRCLLAFQTATALAQYDSDTSGELVILRLSHIRRVVGLSSQFHKYLASISRGMTPAEIALKKGLRNDLVDAPRKKDTKVPQPRRRYAKYYENDEDEEDDVDDRRVRKSQNTNAKTLPTRFYDDDEEGTRSTRSASASKRNMRTPDSDEEAEMEKAQKPKASAQRRDKFGVEDEDEDDPKIARRRTDRRPKAMGTKANSYEDHESDEDEEEEPPRESFREAKPRRQ